MPSDPTRTPAGVFNDTLQRRLLAALSVIGLLVALYLVYFKFYPASALCTGAGDCASVNASAFSEIRGVPVAVLGALAYAFLLVVTLLEKHIAFLEEWGALITFGTALSGTIYSAYLTYIEVAVIHAICPYCVTSAVVMTLIFILSIFRLRKYI